MTKEDKIIEAIEAAIQKGIKISPCSAAYNFAIKNGNNPSSCSGIGALILHYNLAGNNGDFLPDWHDKLCKQLETTPWWLWRFHIGFDIGNIVLTKVATGGKKARESKVFAMSPKGERIPLVEDDVSKFGLRLRKLYTKKGIHDQQKQAC